MKPVRFVGTAREDLAAFAEPARRAAGYELFMVQVGREPSDFSPYRTWVRVRTRFGYVIGQERFG